MVTNLLTTEITIGSKQTLPVESEIAMVLKRLLLKHHRELKAFPKIPDTITPPRRFAHWRIIGSFSKGRLIRGRRVATYTGGRPIPNPAKAKALDINRQTRRDMAQLKAL